MKNRNKQNEIARAVIVNALIVLLLVNPLTTKFVFHLSNGWRIFPAVLDGFLVCVALAAIGQLYTNHRGFQRLWIGLLVIMLPMMFLTELLINYDRATNKLQQRGTRLVNNVHEPHDKLGWITIPNEKGRHASKGNFDVTYTFDELGRKRIRQKSGSIPTLHVFGDSFAFGHGVSNSESALAILSKLLGRKANVQNYAVMGYGLEQIALRFLLVADAVKRGDVVLFAPTSADIARNFAHREFVCWVTFDQRQPLKIYPWFRNGAWEFVDPNEDCSYVFDYLLMHSSLPFGVIWRAWTSRTAWPDTIKSARELIQEAKGIAESKGATFRLLIFTRPSECKVGHHDVEWGDIGIPYGTLLPYCPEDRNLLDTLRFPTDGHLSPAGNLWAAGAIENWLRSNGVL